MATQDSQSASARPQGDEGAPLRFEEALGRLEAIVHALEEGGLGLDESLRQYEAGVKLLRQCHTLLDGAQRRIELLSGVDADGNPITQRFQEGEASGSLVEKAANRSRRRSTPARCTPPGNGGDPAGPDAVDVPGGVE